MKNFDLNILFGVLAIIAGSLILSWAGTPQLGSQIGPFLIAGACLAWAIDNNLTRKISSGDPVQIAAIKGLAAGATLIGISLFAGIKIAGIGLILLTCLLGLISYGLSLIFFVLSLRNLGTARTAAYFSLAPFAGAVASFVILGEHASILFAIAAILMAIGIYLHISESHKHEHRHEKLLHHHKHIHDEHHRHEHDNSVSDTQPHSHWHEHQPLIHSHPHYPDIHHRHTHE